MVTTHHLLFLCDRDMDRETTHRLLRESIVFLCKTHLGYDASGGFEVDAIICVSRRTGSDDLNVSYDDPRPTVFKFHECVTDEDGRATDNVNDWLLSGCSGSFVDGLLKQTDLVDAPATKRRKTGENNVQPAVANFGSENMEMADLSLVKHEPGCSNIDDQTSVKSNEQIDAAADRSQTMRRLRSADAVSFDIGSGRNHTEIPNTKEISSASMDSTGGITELEKLVSKPVMSGPPPLKLIPNVAKLQQSGSDELVKRPKSHNSNSEQFPETVADFSHENANDSTSGMEQSTPRSCDLCGLMFADFPTFNVHCATMHSRYACPFCALLFPCESTRERHLFEHTGEQVDDDGLVVDVERDAIEVRGSVGSTCRSAQSEFGKQHADYWSADVLGSVDMSDMDDGPLTSVNGTLYDPQVVTRRGVLSCQTLRAIAQLDPSHPFVCDVCRARFSSSSDLCDHCTSSHHRIPCPYCGRSFSQKASMERHMRQHTGERPYECTLCNSSYTRKENLQTHMTRMHGSSAAQQHLGSDFICVE